MLIHILNLQKERKEFDPEATYDACIGIIGGADVIKQLLLIGIGGTLILFAYSFIVSYLKKTNFDELVHIILALGFLMVFQTCAQQMLLYPGEMFDDKTIEPLAYAEANNLVLSNDTGLAEKVVKEVIAADEKAVNDYKSGKEKALMSLFGKCMRELKGNCDPQTLRTLLIDAINKL
mgnify:CR=1 FL=1